MRRHFHHCAHLRLISLDVSDISRARRHGTQVLDELCEAKGLAPCWGLADCDVLSPAQKRELLVARATRLREQEGGASPLADAGEPRARELAELRDLLLDERNEIAQENRRRATEAGGALLRNPRPIAKSEERELRGAGISVFLDDDLRELRTARLDALDRALDALARGRLGDCARCGAPIEIARLHVAPDTTVCGRCAGTAAAGGDDAPD
jgi:RNA polymerase-binding transcription factor DksA